MRRLQIDALSQRPWVSCAVRGAVWDIGLRAGSAEIRHRYSSALSRCCTSRIRDNGDCMGVGCVAALYLLRAQCSGGHWSGRGVVGVDKNIYITMHTRLQSSSCKA